MLRRFSATGTGEVEGLFRQGAGADRRVSRMSTWPVGVKVPPVAVFGFFHRIAGEEVGRFR